jgi:hypothetical protein|tara:strand:+ start:2393 stop:2908 length:516 start_codon:yes stop_codon:yes gene_type:complete
MLINEVFIIVIVIFIIGGIIHLINKQVYEFNIFKRAVILQDKNLEKHFNNMDNDFNEIKKNTENVQSKINNNNINCLGKFSACNYNTKNNCVKKYKIYRDNKGNGKKCEFNNGHIESCPDGGGNCKINQDCKGNWNECDSNNVKTFKVTQSHKGNEGGECKNKHGDTEFCI